MDCAKNEHTSFVYILFIKIGFNKRIATFLCLIQMNFSQKKWSANICYVKSVLFALQHRDNEWFRWCFLSLWTFNGFFFKHCFANLQIHTNWSLINNSISRLSISLYWTKTFYIGFELTIRKKKLLESQCILSKPKTNMTEIVIVIVNTQKKWRIEF